MKKLFFFIFVSLLFPAVLEAAIARTGACSATATSCTLSGVSTGDLVVSFAYRSASTTAPSADASNTSIRTTATSSGGTTSAIRISCRKASSGSDTSSGTYANATSVAAVAYSGTSVGTTANCNTTGIGTQGATGNGSNWAKTSTSVNYPALTLTHSSGSWVFGFMGGSTSGQTCTPSGMTSASATGTVRVSDTNGAATSWSATTCSVTSETWMSETMEIMAPLVCAAGSTWTATGKTAKTGVAAVDSTPLTLTGTSQGSLLVIGYNTFDNDGGSPSSVAVSDATNGAWTTGFYVTNPNWGGQGMAYFANNAGGDLTITINPANNISATADVSGFVAEFCTGAVPASPASGTAASNEQDGSLGGGPYNVASSGSTTAADNNALYVAFAGGTACSGQAITENAGGEGFILAIDDDGYGVFGSLVYKILSGAATSQSESWTVNSCIATGGGIMAFKPIAGGGAAPVNQNLILMGVGS